MVFFSSDAAEQLLATHVIPPLDACTYMGLDSGAPPIQVTAPLWGTGPLAPWVLLLGISVGSACPCAARFVQERWQEGSTQQQGGGQGGCTGQRGCHPAGPFSPQLSLFFDIVLCMAGGMTKEAFVKGGSDTSVRSARSVLWTALRDFPLSMGE